MSTPSFAGRVIFCADVQASARFYEQALGFQRESADGADISLLAPVTKAADATVSVLLHPSQTPPTPVDIGWFETSDVDAVVDRVRAAGYPDQPEPSDAPWGVREATVRDPDGHALYVTGPLRTS